MLPLMVSTSLKYISILFKSSPIDENIMWQLPLLYVFLNIST